MSKVFLETPCDFRELTRQMIWPTNVFVFVGVARLAKNGEVFHSLAAESSVCLVVNVQVFCGAAALAFVRRQKQPLQPNQLPLTGAEVFLVVAPSLLRRHRRHALSKTIGVIALEIWVSLLMLNVDLAPTAAHTDDFLASFLLVPFGHRFDR